MDTRFEALGTPILRQKKKGINNLSKYEQEAQKKRKRKRKKQEQEM